MKSTSEGIHNTFDFIILQVGFKKFLVFNLKKTIQKMRTFENSFSNRLHNIFFKSVFQNSSKSIGWKCLHYHVLRAVDRGRKLTLSIFLS